MLVRKNYSTTSSCARSRIVMKTFLNVFRQLREINLRDSRTAGEDDAVGFHSAYRDVFVFFPFNSFEVVREKASCRENERNDQQVLTHSFRGTKPVKTERVWA